MSKRSRKSKRRVNAAMSMVFLTAILLIASTYAWFSANRVVTINTITAQVSAAEGLQISLDGEKWSSTLDITEANLSAAKNKDAENPPLLYSLPETLTPVSTAGTTTNGKLDMRYGEINADGNTLTGVAAESDASTTKYVCFDLFLKNSSSQATDALQLYTNSNVVLTAGTGVTDTGLEYSVRAGFVLYSETAAMTASGTDIRKLAFGTPVVSIWEPNNATDGTKHITEVVANDRRITGATQQFSTCALNADAAGTIYQVNTSDGKYYEEGTFGELPDQLVVEAAGSTVEGATKIGDAIEGLTVTKTVSTAGTIGQATDLTSVTDGTTKLSLPGNKVSKMRVYLWIEGQDPDCNDTASTGRSIDFNISLTKPVPETPVVVQP